MATRSVKEKEELLLWSRTIKEKGQRLVRHAQSLSASVFASSDNLISFLDLAARIHHYDAYNLLLIWERCPTATCLAGYKVWERQLPAGTQVLKDEHKGKGIELVAPFTDSFNQQNAVVWYSVTIFDISQTTLPVVPPAFESGYILDSEHEYFLLDALKLTLGTVYERSVLIQTPTKLQQDTGLPGQITDRAVFIRDDLSLKEQLQWLTESIVTLEGIRHNLSSATLQLFIHCVSYCLFHIWDLKDYALPPRSIQLSGVAKQEMVFLHLVRDTLRTLNNLICSCYISCRQDDENSIDIEDFRFGGKDEEYG